MPRRLLTHALATFLISSGLGVAWFLAALIARKRFGAGEWETFLVTVSLPVMAIASLQWSDWLRKLTLRWYLWWFWFAACAPLALIALAQGFWGLWIWHVVAAFGQAGWSPALSLILKRCYRDQIHGRAFGVLNVAQIAAIMSSTFLCSRWLDVDPDSFRIFIPMIVVAQGLGVILLARTLPTEQAAADDVMPSTAPVGSVGVPAQCESRASRSPMRAPFGAVREMFATLKADPIFLRYEAAFMTYGAGYMICEVLFPVFVTDRLHLSYAQIAMWAVMVRGGAQLVLSAPAGWVMDGLGAARTSALSFAVLALYPVALMFAGGTIGLGFASAIFGVGLAGVLQGWLLGPVSLAPSPERAPYYVAIHAALVGIRGVLFQAVGMLVYWLTGSFSAAFALASFMFLYGAWQMLRLARPIRERRQALEAARAARDAQRAKPVGASASELVCSTEGK